MRFFLKTYGCKVNQYESQAIREQLACEGYLETDDIRKAGLCVINTCTVTARADKECRDMIRRIIRQNQQARIIVTGCSVDSDKSAVKLISPRIEVISNKDKPGLPYVIKNPAADNSMTDKAFSGITSFKNHSRAFVKVQDGCDNFCSYCIVPFVRGRSRSRNQGEILDEASALIKNGYKEIVLTGICLGDFGKDLDRGMNVANLVREISLIEGDFRIRLSSIEIFDITDDLIYEMKSSGRLCHHLHIPLQSGDNDVLKNMNRRYTADDFIAKVSHIRSIIPDIGITTDIIAGFPGESEPCFLNTVKTVEKIRPSRTHIFTYSPRPGTKAAELRHDISETEKRRRHNRLKALTDALSEDFKNRLSQSRQRVLVESLRDKPTGMLGGYTDTYIRVLIEGADELIGKFVYL
jgi:threonylcarbamoyladenosine tRNA methylthiotransferase MtaB